MTNVGSTVLALAAIFQLAGSATAQVQNAQVQNGQVQNGQVQNGQVQNDQLQNDQTPAAAFSLPESRPAALAGAMFPAGPGLAPTETPESEFTAQHTAGALPPVDVRPVAAAGSRPGPLPLHAGTGRWNEIVTTFEAPVQRAAYELPIDPQATTAPPEELLRGGYDAFDAGPADEEQAEGTSRFPFGDLWTQYHCVNERIWLSADYLNWRVRGYDVPALVTRSPAPANAASGVLGQSNVSVLLGADRFASDYRDGGRFRFGFWSVDGQFVGYQFEYFGFESGRDDFYVAPASGGPIYARPFFNTDTGVNAEDASLLNGTNLTLDFTGIGAFPYDVDGEINVDTHSDLHSAAATRKHVLWVDFDTNVRLDYLIGFRYLRLDERLNITDTLTLTALGGGPLGTGTRIRRVDDINATNDYYAGEVGLSGEAHRGRFSVVAMGKIALGNMHEVVHMTGATFTAAPAGAFIQTGAGGLLVQPSNDGRRTRDSFVIMPEAELSLAFQVTNNLVAKVGANVLHINRVVRPGDQIDRNINATRIPPAAAPAGPITPVRKFAESYLWAYGTNASLEFRY